MELTRPVQFDSHELHCKKSTHRHPCGNQIAFVEHEDEMFVGFLTFEVTLDMFATRAHGIAGI